MPDQEVKINPAQPAKPIDRNEKARNDLRQKLFREGQETIAQAVKSMQLVVKKIPKQQHPMIAMDIVNKVMDMFSCKTGVVHQPQIMPLTEAELMKRAKDRLEQAQSRASFEEGQALRKAAMAKEEPVEATPTEESKSK